MTLRFIELSFRARFSSLNSDLPPFLGATLRGALGYLLKQTVCQVAHGECPRCILKAVCPYPVVFEGTAPENRTVLTKYPNIPQPFILVVPSPERHRTSDTLEWGVRLFGPAIRYWPYLLHVFRTAGERGIGSRQSRFEISTVTDGSAGQTTLWREGDVDYQEPVVQEVPDNERLPDRCTLRWRFLTPVRLVERSREAGQPLDGLSLMLSMRRRFQIMNWFYTDHGTTNLSTDSPLNNDRFERAEFRTIENTLRHWDLRRFSGRQKQHMELRGLLGEMVIEGPWGRVGPALEAVRALHLGKATSFGFGRVEWEVV